MKNKKIIFIFIVLLIIIVVGGYFIINYVKSKKQETKVEEYVPEEEITEEQYRQTIVSLFFANKETGELTPEARMIDIKEIMNEPYKVLMNMLIEGPKNEKFAKVIPDGTKVLNINKEGDTLTIDVSSEFLNYDKNSDIAKNNLIYSIVNTMTELTEINHVKFLINGDKEKVDTSYDSSSESTDYSQDYSSGDYTGDGSGGSSGESSTGDGSGGDYGGSGSESSSGGSVGDGSG